MFKIVDLQTGQVRQYETQRATAVAWKVLNHRREKVTFDDLNMTGNDTRHAGRPQPVGTHEPHRTASACCCRRLRESSQFWQTGAKNGIKTAAGEKPLLLFF